MTLYEIELAVAQMYGWRENIIVTNTSWGMNMHECDLLIVGKSMHGKEIEIKRTLTDLKKDAKKKHAHAHKNIRKLYFAMPNKMEKHIAHVPAHAGIIFCYFEPYGNVTARIFREAEVNKTAVKFTNDQLQQLSRLGTMRIWKLTNKIIQLQNQLNTYKNGRSKIKHNASPKPATDLR